MDAVERYLFDLNGYLVLRSVLSQTEVRALRDEARGAGIDEALNTHKYLHAGFPPGYYDDDSWTGVDGYRYVSESYLLDWGPAVRSLVAHPRLLPYLAELTGPDFRLDHSYGVFSRGHTGPHALHNGGKPFDPTQMYLYRDGRIYNSMLVVQFALSDVRPGDGGFCCIPGSHKANFVLPAELASLEPSDEDCQAQIRHVPMGTGDVLLFTEAVTHGALGWQGADDRMALLFKYCSGAMQWEQRSPFVSPGHRWTPTQAQVMTGPYAGGRAAVDLAGER
jgi:hypothetical protein